MQLFDLLSLFYAFLGIRAISTAIKNWRAFSDEQLTGADRRLASELAFFVLVPIGVLLHELGHAAATIQVGGQVVGFHYALFYGYVIPRGNFTDLQDWWISFSGNFISIIFGFLPLAIIPLTRRVWQKYFLLAFARIQLGWSLVGYPLLTFAGFQGDWKAIYFLIPTLGVAVFIAQAALVLTLWLLDRGPFVKRWEVSLYAGAREQLAQLDGAIKSQPGAANPIIERGNFYAANAHPELAVADYQAALRLDPGNPRALYNLGHIKLAQRNFPQAEKYFRAALTRAGSDIQLAPHVHYGLGLAFYNLNALKDSIEHFSSAIAREPSVPEFYFWRATAYRATRDDANARADFARVEEMVRVSDPELAARAREMLKT